MRAYSFVLAVVLCLIGGIARAADSDTPGAKDKHIDHTVVEQGQDLVGSFIYVGPDTEALFVITTPDSSHKLVKKTAELTEFSEETAWKELADTEQLSKFRASAAPGKRVQAVARGEYVVLGGGGDNNGGGGGGGGKLIWSTMSIDLDIDADTNRNGYANLGSDVIADMQEDKDEQNSATNPVGALVLLDLQSRLLLRQVMPVGRPEGKVVLEQWSVAETGKPSGLLKTPKVKVLREVDGSEVKTLYQGVADPTNLWDEASQGELKLQMVGQEPGQLILVARYARRAGQEPFIEYEDKVRVSVLGGDMDIYSGQNAVSPVPESDHDRDGVEDEEQIGAFTVANLNDTNGDGHPDNDDSYRPVRANGSLGRDEQDLMRLRLFPPQPAGLRGEVRIKVVSGDVAFWPDALKAGNRITKLTFPVTDFAGRPHIDWWVEARKATDLQGIKLEYAYRPEGTSDFQSLDRVSATAIWAFCTQFIHDNLKAVDVNKTLRKDPQYTSAGEQGGHRVKALVDLYDGTGVKTNTGAGGNADGNAMVIEFTVSPANIYIVPELYGDGTRARPWFDVSRKMEAGIFRWGHGETPPVQSRVAGHDIHPHFPERIGQDNERGNDDSAGGGDENDEPTDKGHMWAFDCPQMGNVGAIRVLRGNFKEFLRMGVTSDPTDSAYATSGSRCSSFVDWQSKTTRGLAVAPNEIDSGNLTFGREALHTQASSARTTPCFRHHGVMRGLDIADSAGPNPPPPGLPESVHLLLVDDDNTYDNTLDDLPAVQEVGKLAAGAGGAATLVGDQTAYTGVGYFASRFDGEIAGPMGSSGEVEAELAHQIEVAGSWNPESDNVLVTGRSCALPTPVPGAMALGRITAVGIAGATAEAEDNLGGNQTVKILLVDDDDVDDETLHAFSEDVPKQMWDDVPGAPPVTAVKHGLLIPFNSNRGRIASRADGTVIGPTGSSHERQAELAYEIEMTGSNPQSPSVSVTGPKYSMTAPAIGTNPIPIGGQSTVTMASIYIEATRAGGNEEFVVHVVDEDGPLDPDDVLDRVGASIPRPADCFKGALIGPAATVVGTITNPAPGGVVKGPAGTSGERKAEIGYEIGGNSDNSPTVTVTAASR